MSEMVDLTPAARHMSVLLRGISDDQLAGATPCERSALGDLVDHIAGIAHGFSAAARKDLGPTTSSPPAPDAARLPADWRTRIPAQLDALAKAWTEPAAWQGATQVGGVDLPSAVAGQVGLNELVLHGWDIARASGQRFDPDPQSLRACWDSVSQMYPPDQPQRRTGIFGPPVQVPDDAPLVDRLVALSGRDPGWRAPA